MRRMSVAPVWLLLATVTFIQETGAAQEDDFGKAIFK